ncbi:SDR family NAD(P)-dependent oxidoreductase [Streptomyces pseudovenezuelae]|uniref:SDR family NAD(P)-dependent oxidoreductase n=1 Tax=Streptomyces pseudovenezuelae TaxID=67350 RepID=UPI003D7B3749
MGRPARPRDPGHVGGRGPAASGRPRDHRRHPALACPGQSRGGCRRQDPPRLTSVTNSAWRSCRTHPGGVGSRPNVSSLAAWEPESAPVAYASSKIALHALTRHTAHAWGKKNIRANAVAPGFVLTENVRTGTPSEVREAFLARTALPRLGEPEDLASMLAFLPSAEPAWLTGQTMRG